MNGDKGNQSANVNKKTFLHDVSFAVKLSETILQILSLEAELHKAISKLIFFVSSSILIEPYILAVSYLEKIYNKNPVLIEKHPNIIWREVKTLEGNFLEIIDAEKGLFHTEYQHIGDLKRILILEKIHEKDIAAQLTVSEIDFLNDTISKICQVRNQLDEAYEEREKFPRIESDKVYFRLERFKDYGIYINKRLLIKPRNGIGETILDQCLDHPGEKIEILTRRSGKTIISILEDMHFDANLRKLFFPLIRKNEILFRPEVTGEDIVNESIDIEPLKQWLNK